MAKRHTKYLITRITLIPISAICILSLHLTLIKIMPGSAEDILYEQSKQPLLIEGADALKPQTIHPNHSLFKHLPVHTLIQQRLPVSLTLTFIATTLTYLFATVLAYLQYQHPKYQATMQYLLAIFSTAPSSLIFVILIHYIQPQTHLLILPALLISLKHCAKKTALIYHCIKRESQQPYIIAAKQRHVAHRTLLCKYLLPNALINALTSLPRYFTYTLLSGTLMAEVLFSIDGIGRLSFQAIQSHDYPLIIGCLCYYSLLTTISYLLGDIIHLILNPNTHFRSMS